MILNLKIIVLISARMDVVSVTIYTKLPTSSVYQEFPKMYGNIICSLQKRKEKWSSVKPRRKLLKYFTDLLDQNNAIFFGKY